MMAGSVVGRPEKLPTMNSIQLRSAPCRRTFLALLAVATPIFAQTDRITYQGRLEQDGTVMNGSVNMRLSIHDAVTGGTELYFTFGPQTVTQGEFTALLGPFGATVFNGNNRWLEIAVDDPAVAGLDYVPLTPRQPITAAPYAVHATTAETITGTLAASHLTGTLNPGLLAPGDIAATLTFSGAGQPFAISNDASPIVTNLNADKLDGLDSAAFLRLTGGTLIGSLDVQDPATINFGNVTRQMLNLFNADYGIGVQTGTLYQRSGSTFSWFKGGSHDDNANTPGSGGIENMRLGSTGSLYLLGPEAGVNVQNRTTTTKQWAAYADDGGAGDTYRIWSNMAGDLLTLDESGALTTTGKITAPAFSATTSDPNGVAVLGINSAMTGAGSGVAGQSLSAQGYGVYGVGADGGYGGKFICNGSNGFAVEGVSDTGFAGFFQGNLHVNGSSTFNGAVTTEGDAGGYALYNRDAFTKRWVMYSRNSGGVDQLAFYSDTTGDVAALSPNGDMYLVGALSTTVLTIRGGADLAEPFPMTDATVMEPGCVVVIDELHPGKLKLSASAYDKKVAGIISGAGGVQPGLRLHQDGVMEGDQHVALSGRVYVKADASTGVIEPGDMLTTSATPGHAMKATDAASAQGAILGKAMSRLDHDTGLVLVLVTLQ